MERDKLGRFAKGMKPWNKGLDEGEYIKHYKNGHPKGMLGKESSKKGKTYEEFYRKDKAEKLIKEMSIKKLGRKLSEETKRKISKGNIGKGVSMKTKEKIKKKLIGHEVSKETREKISKSSKGRKLSKEILERRSEQMKFEYKFGLRKAGMLGKKLTLEQRKRMTENLKQQYRLGREPIRMCGKKNPSWLGGKSFEPYDINFNNKFKRAIRKRDNQVCMMCGIHREKVKRAFNVHHVNYDKKLTIPQNCISLCLSCHTKTNHNRQYWIKFFQDLLSERYCYQYNENNEVIMEVKI